MSIRTLQYAIRTWLVSGASHNGPMFGNVAKAILALRTRAGWSQETLGQRAGVSRSKVGRTERWAVTNMTVGDLDKIASALGATLQVQVRWQGEQLDRLLDAAHAALQEQVASTLEGLGWLVRAEVSFNHFGDRGRVDILALHPRFRVLVVAEIKSGIGDLQETLGRLDTKVRLGKVIAAEQGWNDVAAVVPALVIGDTRAARRTIAAHVTLFTRFGVRGRQALAWLRRPIEPVPTGLLWFTRRSNAHPMRRSGR